MEIQSVVFRRGDLSQTEQKKWLKRHNFKTEFPGKPQPHTTKTQVRYRQQPPDKYDYFTSKRVAHGIAVILGHL